MIRISKFLPSKWLLACLILAPTLEAQEQTKFRIGIIGLDTSHATAFTKVINSKTDKDFQDLEVVAAYPKGSPDIETSVSRVPIYTKELVSLGIRIVPSIDELLQQVDGVLLETNDGRPHLEQIRPVLRAKKPVFIDKPLAGSLEDVVTIMQEAKSANVPIFSSSSLRYISEAQNVRAGAIGKVIGCDAYSPASLEPTHPDLFWYGIHGVELLFTVMGPGCKTVVRSSTAGSDVVVGIWSDGRIGTFRGIRDGTRGYGGKAFGAKENRDLGTYEGYRPLLIEVANFFRTGKPSVPLSETLEIYAFMEAADQSKRQGGMPVSIADVLRKTGLTSSAKDPSQNDTN